MRNKITAILASLFLVLSFTSLKAEVNFGVSIIAGQASTSGHELENGSTSDKNTKEIEEQFVGGSLFMEFVNDNGVAIGIDYVPVDVELGDGKRTDTSTGTGSVGGTRTASADIEDLMTLYTNMPMGSNGWYALLGYHMATVTTAETLPNSSYGNEDITGYQLGLGKRSGNRKIELSYSDFEDIDISATGGNTNSVSANADSLQLRVSFGF